MDQIERITETICRNTHRVGLTEIAALDIRDLEFHDWVRSICNSLYKGLSQFDPQSHKKKLMFLVSLAVRCQCELLLSLIIVEAI